ncbi:lipopolysaccharide biosynthesis protein [Flavivirga aquimarina]|uniref:Lipopolysaccharide biosynthesis protein n=1 Tax=Flavivirga aquimarina TaxID=2027862 RepID=A0ABT8W713_9FLAO|nr:lipopolysaccharide biosynthesis protein [Flavivirga aquimarina]MDO5968900.1 lipopolysaccharide biosynthesis protein [Flavivirga aquimarina]
MLNKKSLKNQTLSGIAWRGSSDIIQQILQIIFTMILARLLSKSDFGLVAMAMLVNRFVVAMTNIGFGGAIIQSQMVNKNQISAIFYIQLTINIFLTIVVFFSADLAAGFFEALELAPLIRVFSFVIVLQTLQFPNILLRKELKFKSFSLIEIFSMVLSNGVAIFLAVIGYGVWALVWRLIIQRILFGLLSFYYGNWLPTKPEFKGIKPLFKFGVNMLGSNMVYYFVENLVAILTGKYLGKEVLGLFNLAYNLAIIPATKIKTIITTVLTASFSKIQFKTEKFVNGYGLMLKYTSLVFIPLMLFIAASSYNTIPLFYGNSWSGASPFLLILCFVGILRGISHMLRSAILAKGKSQIIFRSALIEMLVSVPMMWFLMPKYKVNGLIGAYLVGVFFGFLYTGIIYNREVNLKYAFLKGMQKGVKIGAVIFVVVSLQYILNISRELSLILQIISSLVVYYLMIGTSEKQTMMLFFKRKLNKISVKSYD